MLISVSFCGSLTFGVVLSVIMSVAALRGLRNGEMLVWTFRGWITLRGDRARRLSLVLLALTGLTFSAFVILPVLDWLMN